MKFFNYFVGAIGVISFILALVVHFHTSERIRLKEGPSYYYEASDGYGILVAIKPFQYDRSAHVPTYQVIFFQNTVESAHPFFSPIVIDADEQSVWIDVRSAERPGIGLTVYQSRTESEPSWTRIGKTFDDRFEFYTDTNGDFLPDRKYTEFRNGGRKIESILYSYEEIEIEQIDDGNSVKPPGDERAP